MKYIKRARSEKEFAHLCHPNYANGTQTVTYQRTDEEYNSLVTEYNLSPADSKYIYPKRILHSSKCKTYKCDMTWNYELYNGYHAIRVKINNFTPGGIALNTFVLCLEMEKRRYGRLQTKTFNRRMLSNLYNKSFVLSDTSVNNYYKSTPVVGQEYIFYICPMRSVITKAKKHAEILPEVQAYDEYFLNIKVRPTLVYKGSFQGDELDAFQFDTDIWSQDYLFLHLQLDKFINLNN